MKKKNTTLLAMLLCVASLSSNAQNWALTGNAATNPNNHFVGTTDSKALVFRTKKKKYWCLFAKDSAQKKLPSNYIFLQKL